MHIHVHRARMKCDKLSHRCAAVGEKLGGQGAKDVSRRPTKNEQRKQDGLVDWEGQHESGPVLTSLWPSGEGDAMRNLGG